MTFYTGIKDLDFIIIKYLTQMRYEDVLNEYRKEVKIIKKFVESEYGDDSYFYDNSALDSFYYYKGGYGIEYEVNIKNIKYLKIIYDHRICLYCGILAERGHDKVCDKY